jgi:hypothetical protein
MTNTKPETTKRKLTALRVYEIQTHTFCNGWVNTWTYEDSNGDMRPEIFSSRKAAQAALDEYLQELAEDTSLGNISDYDREDFRIQAVSAIATVEGGVV